MLHDTTNSSSLAVVQMTSSDDTHRIIEWNFHAEVLFQADRTFFDNRPFLELFSEAARPNVSLILQGFRVAVGAGTPAEISRTFRTQCLRYNGTKFSVELTLRLLVTIDSLVLLASFQPQRRASTHTISSPLSQHMALFAAQLRRTSCLDTHKSDSRDGFDIPWRRRSYADLRTETPSGHVPAGASVPFDAGALLQQHESKQVTFNFAADDKNRNEFPEDPQSDGLLPVESLPPLLEVHDTGADTPVEDECDSNFFHKLCTDLRHPINSTISMIDNFLSTSLSEEQKRHVESLRFCCDHLAQTLNSVLESGSCSSLTLNPQCVVDFSPVSLLEAVAARFPSSTGFVPHERMTQLKMSVEGDGMLRDLRCVGRASEIEYVMQTLLMNAVNYTECQRLTIAVRPDADRGDKDMVLLFEINCIGTSPRFLQNLNTAGMGLFVCRALVEDMGGELGTLRLQGPEPSVRMWFTVRVRKSSTASLDDSDCEKNDGKDPNQGQEDVEIEVVRASSVGDKSQVRLLVVDDNDMSLRLIQRFLDSAGYIYETAHDGAEAVELFRTHPAGYFDVVLCDLLMPVMDGFEAVAAMRKIEQAWQKESGRVIHTPMVACTASTSDDEFERCVDAGFDDFVAKPLRRHSLQLLIQKWLGVISNTAPDRGSPNTPSSPLMSPSTCSS